MAPMPGLSPALLLLSLLPTPALSLSLEVTQTVLPPHVQVLHTPPHTVHITVIK